MYFTPNSISWLAFKKTTESPWATNTSFFRPTLSWTMHFDLGFGSRRRKARVAGQSEKAHIKIYSWKTHWAQLALRPQKRIIKCSQVNRSGWGETMQTWHIPHLQTGLPFNWTNEIYSPEITNWRIPIQHLPEHVSSTEDHIKLPAFELRRLLCHLCRFQQPWLFQQKLTWKPNRELHC